MSYNQIFLDALENVQSRYMEEKIRFFSESDLQSHLFSECLRLLEKENFETPFKIYVEKGVFNKRQKIDLVLSADEVLVELKLEPDYPGVSKPVVFSTIRDAGGPGSGSIERDLEKIEEYSKNGKHAHFIILDEDGRHSRKVAGAWKKVVVRQEERYWLHVEKSPV